MANLSTNWNKIPQEYIDGLLEFLRIVVLSVIPVILIGINGSTGQITINWQLVGAIGVIAALKALDELLHEKGKSTKNESMTKGITRF